MLFHSVDFLVFLILFLACYLPFRQGRYRRVGVLSIVLFSAIFYGWWDWRFLLLMWGSVVGDYVFGLLIGQSRNPGRRKLFLAASLVFNLGILGFFKYWNFFVENLAAAGWHAADQFRVSSLILPLGISFYTFQSMSYTLDVYRGKQEPVRDLMGYAAFVTYFPHMVAGPIQKFHYLYPQIIQPGPLSAERTATGLFLFCFGLFQKAVADCFALYHNPIFDGLAAAEPAQVVTAVFSFGIQIYCDFAGYSLMAIGLARLMGVDLLQNFEAPYLSTSVRDFWRRWHISLSTWLRDYLYISLGGSRVTESRHLLNLMVTMTLCGLWHGAGWGFLVWGALHGLYLCFNSLTVKIFPERQNASRAWSCPGSLACWAVTVVAVNYAWIYFRCPNLSQARVANLKLWEWIRNPSWPPLFSGNLAYLLIPIVAADVYIAAKKDLAATGVALSYGRAVRLGFGAAAFLLIGFLLLVGQPTNQFIYFQF